MPDEQGTAYVLVPVPENRVLDVYALLAPDRDLTKAPKPAVWTVEDVASLRHAVRSETARRFLAALSDHPDEWLSRTAICGLIDVTPIELRTALSGLRRTIKAHMERDDLPFDVRTGQSDSRTQTLYRMKLDVAERLKSGVNR